MAQLFDQRARNNTRRSAGPSYLDRAAAERTSFFREQRMLVAWADQPVINQNAWWRERAKGFAQILVAHHHN